MSASRSGRIGDLALLRQLGAARDRVRSVMREFHIGSGSIGAMAADAERSISDTGVLSNFLRRLIEMHEFAREAKGRGLLWTAARAGDADGTADGTADGNPAEHQAFALQPGCAGQPADAVVEHVSRAFFARLDIAGGRTISNRGQP